MRLSCALVNIFAFWCPAGMGCIYYWKAISSAPTTVADTVAGVVRLLCGAAWKRMPNESHDVARLENGPPGPVQLETAVRSI
jgi:hypothetical protein